MLDLFHNYFVSFYFFPKNMYLNILLHTHSEKNSSFYKKKTIHKKVFSIRFLFKFILAIFPVILLFTYKKFRTINYDGMGVIETLWVLFVCCITFHLLNLWQLNMQCNADFKIICFSSY